MSDLTRQTKQIEIQQIGFIEENLIVTYTV